jgi:hypothetical protein
MAFAATDPVVPSQRPIRETPAEIFVRKFKGLQAQFAYQNERKYMELTPELNTELKVVVDDFCNYLDEIFQRDKFPAGWITSKIILGVAFFMQMYDIHFATRQETRECWAAFKACVQAMSDRYTQVKLIEDRFND